MRDYYFANNDYVNMYGFATLSGSNYNLRKGRSKPLSLIEYNPYDRGIIRVPPYTTSSQLSGDLLTMFIMYDLNFWFGQLSLPLYV